MINLAVIDLGSNSVRLRVTEIDESGNYNLVRYEKEYVRLSENMGPEKMLKPTPMERTIAALKDFKQICMVLENVRVIAVATAAVRQAANQIEFLKRVKEETGFNIKVISGEREAYLDYVGVTRTLPIKNGLIIDTGGASMELMTGRLKRLSVYQLVQCCFLKSIILMIASTQPICSMPSSESITPWDLSTGCSEHGIKKSWH